MGHQPEAPQPAHQPDGPDTVEARYLLAEDPSEWLRGELTAFYDGDPTRVDDLIENLEDRWEHFTNSIVEPGEILAFEVRVDHGDHDHKMVTATLPHPVELLWVLCQNAEPGDVVEINHHHIDRVDGVALRWPFGVDDAIVATSPDLRASVRGAEYPTAGRPTATVRIPAVAGGVALGVAAGVALGVALGVAAAHLTRRR